MKTVFSTAKELLVEGYDIVIGMIASFPRTVFWLGFTAIVLAWVF